MIAFYLILQDQIKEHHNKNCAGTETNHTNLGIYSLITEQKKQKYPPKSPGHCKTSEQSQEEKTTQRGKSP